MIDIAHLRSPVPASIPVMRWGSVFLITTAIFVATWQVVADETGLPYRYWARYIAALERRLRSMFIFFPGRFIAIGQLVVIFVLLVGALLFDLPFWWALIVVTLVAPLVYLEYERRQRVLALEDQIDNFILALANALKSTPSLASAFGTVEGVIENPIRQEVELANKEMKVGSTLEQALLAMASRVGSRQLDSALSSVLIGRQVGGNVPRVLETTANTLREMKRLDGVIKTKTADGRMQMWVIGSLPLVLILVLNAMQPGYFHPLTQSIVGYAIIFMVSLFWVGGLLVARKVLTVDI
ncbi:MAG: type II secretion system F family protein [Polyangiaceae bacterium]|nr:type II secretion system F family protein [Polyangiaceae bacterium]